MGRFSSIICAGRRRGVVVSRGTGEQLPASCRLFSRIELPAGASIGLHRHEGEAEMFYVPSGHPTLTDDGAEYTAQPGDCIVTRSGHSHAVRNNGGEPVELLACIAKD